MILRAVIFLLIAVSALGQAFVTTNVVTRLPLPWGQIYTNETRLRVPVQTVGVLATNVTAPSVPQHVRATLVKNMLMRWQPSADTNTTFWVFKSTNLVSWAPFTNYLYHVSAAMIETPWDARGFFVVGKSNGATGLKFMPRGTQ